MWDPSDQHAERTRVGVIDRRPGRRLLVLAGLVFGGCGASQSSGTDLDAATMITEMADASDSANDRLDGQGSIVGEVAGQTFEPRSVIAGISPGYAFVFSLVEADHHAVALSSFDDTCGNTDFTGRSVVIDLFSDPTSEHATLDSPGEFDVWLAPLRGGSPPSAPTAVVTYIENRGGGMLQVAQSGIVTVTHVTAERIQGTFDAAFEGGRLRGEFDAPICEPWTRSGSVP